MTPQRLLNLDNWLHVVSYCRTCETWSVLDHSSIKDSIDSLKLRLPSLTTLDFFTTLSMSNFKAVSAFMSRTDVKSRIASDIYSLAYDSFTIS